MRLRFARAVGTRVDAVLASKQYVLAALDDGSYRVYDDARGRSWTIDQRPCGYASLPGFDPALPGESLDGRGMFGAPWVMFSCTRRSTLYALYNVTTRRWHAIGGSAGTDIAFRDAGGSFEVGARWIKLTYTGGGNCTDNGIHTMCGDAYRLQHRLGHVSSQPDDERQLRP